MNELEKKRIIYDALSHQITREDNLVNNRINWFLAFQGFLYAATGAIIGSSLDDCKIVYLVKSIACLGGSIAIIVFVGIIGAEISICRITKRWRKIERNYGKFFPPPYGRGWASFLGAWPRFLLPIVILSAWIVIFLYVDKLFQPRLKLF